MITTQDPYRQAELLTGALEDGVAEGEVDPYMAAAVLVLAGKGLFNRGDTPDIVMRNSVIGGEGYANMTGHFLLGGAEAILTGPHVDKEDKRTKVALADLYLAIAEGSLGNNLKLQQMIKAAALLLEVGGEFKEVYENVVGRMGHLINDNNHST